jgi:hypothetical protein
MTERLTDRTAPNGPSAPSCYLQCGSAEDRES